MDVSNEIVIDRPVEYVAAYAMDPDTAPEWYAKIESVEWRTPPPLTVGSRLAFVARFLGRRLSYTYEIVDLVPMRRLVMSSARGPFPMETTYSWESLGHESTRMTLRNRGGPGGLYRALSPLMRHAMRSANRKDLALLKTILEGRQS